MSARACCVDLDGVPFGELVERVRRTHAPGDEGCRFVSELAELREKL